MSPMLRLEAVSKRFGAIIVADALDLNLAAGEALGIIGPNGAGKTSLFGVVTGTVAADAGRVLFDGVDVTRLSPARRCRLGMARSFQVPQPFAGLTLFENCLVAAQFGAGLRDPAASQAALDALDRCGLSALADRRAGALTLLQRKRLELARALSSNPKLLLLDEVAGGLTEEECAALVALVLEVKRAGVSIIWVEHIVHALNAVVDRLVVINGGAILADGAPDSVIKSAVVQEIYMGLPADV